ncbi:hypothetical protein caldi_22590 [Caldinitratiruptor microaerophilus]|uniref:Thioredoxin domain-containing protein n=1 Tax=Caldinitratiruptor microaerophilus TaxID=671077 RepID=A0AA35CKV8_9FIRM|nr:hypothetical protein caldi_22590 [Caldinitratiruptor microaerophilus]
MNRYLSYAMVALVAVLLLGGSLRPAGARAGERPEVGYRAPDFQVLDLEGRPVRLSDYRGDVVFLNFWASWCPPCKAEMPEIRRLHEEGLPDLTILGVDLTNTEASPEAVARFMAAGGYRWRVPLDTDGAVARAYNVISIPTSFFIDARGIIRSKVIGPMTYPAMKAEYERTLAWR